MFADNMAQFYAVYQVDLKKPSSSPALNQPIAVLSLESDAQRFASLLADEYTGLTFVLTSHEDGRSDYSVCF